MMNTDGLLDFPSEWDPVKFRRLVDEALDNLSDEEFDARIELAAKVGTGLSVVPSASFLRVDWPVGVALVFLHYELLARGVCEN